tara:strand:+ start:189 stop:1007 length:819 start_codon:yes stop_codon:yes gene_type:complete
MLDLHIINGGIGKNIMFSSILDKLENKICISSYWHNLFNNHPVIEACYPDYGWDYYGMKQFYDNFDNIVFTEPYLGNFLKRKTHCIKAYHELLNLKCGDLYHNLHFSNEEIENTKKFVQQLGDFVLVQFIGSDKDFNKDINALGSRNLSLETGQEIINIIVNDLGLSVIEVNNGILNFNNTLATQKLEARDYCLLTYFCKSFISIDSCLNHMSAFKDHLKKGVGLFRDSEYGVLFEYPHNINLYSKLPLKMKFDAKTIVDELMIAMDFNKNQ